MTTALIEELEKLILKYEDGENHDEGAFDADCRICQMLADLRTIVAALSQPPAPSPDPEAVEKVARIIDPAAWQFRGLWPDMDKSKPYRVEQVERAEAKAAEENERAKALSLTNAREIISLLSSSEDAK